MLSIVALSLAVSCGGGEEAASEEEVVDEVATTTEEDQLPTPAPQPEPLMRQALLCCNDLSLEPAMRAYLELGDALREADQAAVAVKVEAMKASFATVDDETDAFVEVVAMVGGLDASSVPQARLGYGLLSDLLVDYVQHAAGGELDLAVAYSRAADHHWLQEGVEPRSPYGDGIQSYSWGRRAEVVAADAERDEGIVSTP